MGFRIYYFFFVFLTVVIAGCVSAKNIETLHSNDSIEIIRHIAQPPMMDSILTNQQLDEYLWSKKINTYPSNNRHEMYNRTDLYYLPYYLQHSIDASKYQIPISWTIVLSLIPMCSGSIDDAKLFKLGKDIVERINSVDSENYEYPKRYEKDLVFSLRDQNWFAPTQIDTIRVRVLAHNDRDALKELEKYHYDKGDSKGLAIYYKFLLNYEGNGDLAERFYRVLEPYFEETPAFRGAVREVLLRAALCDHNERARQLCDSLGFSLCDYRLPLPPQ